jgi:phage shock protein PspC (stress-responsive transcriptional regulator)
MSTQNPNGYRRLVRSNDSMISGVCAGVAEYFGIDPTVVRIIALIAAFLTFPVGPLAYLACWAVIPRR